MGTFPVFPADDYDFGALEVGQALAGLIRRDDNGEPVPGVLGSTAGLLSAVPSAWQVRVRPFTYVSAADGGIQLSGVSSAEDVDVTQAAGSVSAGQARIDRIVWSPTDSEVVVVEGTPAASPVAPPSGDGVSLGTVRVNHGDGMVVGSRVAVDAAETSLVSRRAVVGATSFQTLPPGGYKDVNVSFPAGSFTETPNVQLTIAGSVRSCGAYVLSASATGFKVRFDSWSTLPRQFLLYWRAEQY